MRALTVSAVLLIAGTATHAMVASAATTRPVIFAPGVISGPANDDAATFSPDGRTVYFFRSNHQDYDIMVSHLDGGRWSSPVIAPFSGRWRDLEPAMAPDGTYMVFASSRPIDGGDRGIDGHWGGHLHVGRGGHLWRINHVGSGWSEPILLPDTVNLFDSTFSPAVAGDGSLYFMAATADHGGFQLYCAPFRNGAYQSARPLPFSTGKWDDDDPAITPDQAFIVFSSNRPPSPGSDLFIAFRDHGHWEQPIDLGSAVNNPAGSDEVRLGPDGHTLYFSTGYVVPPPYPKTTDAARSGLQQMQDWNNGGDNIWEVDLTPWLEQHARTVARSQP